jgi:hypothetical protein
MQPDAPAIIQLAGFLAAAGALLYALSDVLLLAHEVGPRQPVTGLSENDLEGYAVAPFSARDLLNLAALPASRLAWGGLIGVLSTPLLLAGLWPMYVALQPAGTWQALGPTLLLAVALILAPFVHGSFIYVEQNAQVLVRLSPEERPVLGETLRLQLRLLATTYAVIAIAVLAASILFSVVVAFGVTLLPRWMAAVNPLTVIVGWLMIRRLLPARITRYAEGAGFNIGFFVFFLLLTLTLA